MFGLQIRPSPNFSAGVPCAPAQLLPPCWHVIMSDAFVTIFKRFLIDWTLFNTDDMYQYCSSPIINQHNHTQASTQAT